MNPEVYASPKQFSKQKLSCEDNIDMQNEMQFIMQELKARDKELNEMVSSHNAQMRAWEKDQRRIIGIEKKNQDIEGELRVRNQQLRLLVQRLKNSEICQKNKDKFIETAKNKLVAADCTIEKLSNEKKELEVLYRNLNGSLSDIYKKFSSLQQQEKELFKQLQDKDSILAATNCKIAEMKSKINKLDTDLYESLQVNSIYLHEAECFKAKFQQCKADLDRNMAESGNFSCELENLRQEVCFFKMEVKQLTDSLTSKENELRTKTELLDSLKFKQARADTELTGLRNMYERQQTALDLLQTNLEKSRNLLSHHESRLCEQNQISGVQKFLPGPTYSDKNTVDGLRQCNQQAISGLELLKQSLHSQNQVPIQNGKHKSVNFSNINSLCNTYPPLCHDINSANSYASSYHTAFPRYESRDMTRPDTASRYFTAYNSASNDRTSLENVLSSSNNSTTFNRHHYSYDTHDRKPRNYCTCPISSEEYLSETQTSQTKFMSTNSTNDFLAKVNSSNNTHPSIQDNTYGNKKMNSLYQPYQNQSYQPQPCQPQPCQPQLPSNQARHKPFMKNTTTWSDNRQSYENKGGNKRETVVRLERTISPLNQDHSKVTTTLRVETPPKYQASKIKIQSQPKPSGFVPISNKTTTSVQTEPVVEKLEEFQQNTRNQATGRVFVPTIKPLFSGFHHINQIEDPSSVAGNTETKLLENRNVNKAVSVIDDQEVSSTSEMLAIQLKAANLRREKDENIYRDLALSSIAVNILNDDDDNLDDSQLSESTLNLLQEAKLSVEDLAATLLKTEEKTEAIKTAVSKTEVAKFDVSESNANKLEANTEQLSPTSKLEQLLTESRAIIKEEENLL